MANILDILKYGHLTVLSTFEDFPADKLGVPGAVGYWSAKDVTAHLASFELVLVEVFTNILEPCPSPLLDEMIADGQAFNDRQVDVLRKDMTAAQAFEEYKSVYKKSSALATRIPAEAWCQTGILPQYGAEYDLEDFVVYTYYGHKREHCGQVAAFRSRL